MENWFDMPKLKIMVESTIRKYLTGELTDGGFKEKIQAILDEFEEKSLLHRNIGQLTWRIIKENPNNEISLRRSGFCLTKLIQESEKIAIIE